jgi:DNA replication and repair protein RecF
VFLSNLRLADFRSYESVDLSLSPGKTVFVGANGHGKTNLVEAVHYLATLGSHRVSADGPLIRFGQDQALVSARVQAGLDDDRSLAVAIEIRGGQANKAQLNRAPVRPRAIVGAVRVICFAPEDLAIVRGDPAERRRFIDELVISRWPRLSGVKAEYERALKQKTTLLKALSGRSVRRAGTGAEETLDVWDEAIQSLGAEIIAARLRTVLDLTPLVATHYDQIAPVVSAAAISYQSSSIEPELGLDVSDVREQLAQSLVRRRADEITRGVCLVGPHRDDIACALGGWPVKGYASHGEGWSYALALRLASLGLLQDDGIQPILILDDVFAELDDQRRHRVVTAMDSVEQTLVTVAVKGDLPANLEAMIFSVSPGKVTGPIQGER